MIKKYQKKPLIIEALQFTGVNFSKVFSFTEDVFIAGSHINRTVTIMTPEGPRKAINGDMIIKEDGNFSVCKLDIFEKSHEELEK